MFKDKDINIVIEVTNTILDIISSKHIAASRGNLAKYSSKLTGRHREIFDMIISCALQASGKQPISRYNLVVPNTTHLVMLDELIVDFDKDKFNRLPHVLQKTMYLCSSPLVYRTSNANLRKLLNRYYYIDELISITCKRCYCSILNGVLCDSCKSKIEKAVEFQAESFTTTGTTIEAFEYYFKDWQVQVNNCGDYKFNRLANSSIQYQPQLPFKDYQNLLVLIG